MTASPARWRIITARVGDALAGLLVALAAWTHLFGGFRVGSGLFALSTRSGERLLIEAVLLVAVRHVILRRPSLRTRILTWLKIRHTPLSPVPARE